MAVSGKKASANENGVDPIDLGSFLYKIMKKK
jgi:hypothetical protein